MATFHPPVAVAIATPVIAPSSGGRAMVPFDSNAPGGAIAVSATTAHAATVAPEITTLSPADTDALIARLEPLSEHDKPAVPSVRPASTPPARSGSIEPISFVAPAGSAVTDAPVAFKTAPPPLHPPDIQPTGEVRADREIRVRFDEPMVPVAAVGAATVPGVTLSPAVAGTWRWLDTRVLVFEPDGGRFAGATDYTVTVPAGTRAVGGSALAQDATAAMSTTGVTIVGEFPSAVRPDGAIAVMFDQDVDPAALPLKVATDAGTAIPFRLVDEAEADRTWDLDPSLHGPRATGAHHAFVAPQTAWPAGIPLQVTLAAGAPSREGPRKTRQPSFTRFEVVPPFSVTGIACDEDWTTRASNVRCPARNLMWLEFSTQIEPSTYHFDKVQIDGEPQADNEQRGNGVELVAPAVVGKTFTISIASDLRDIHDQPLVGPHHPAFTTITPTFPTELEAPSGLLVLDPRFAIPQWVVTADGVADVRVQLYRVEPADYFAYEAFEAGTRGTPPGKRVFDHSFAVGADQGSTWRVDLRPALAASGVGHIVAIASVRPATRRSANLDGLARRVAWIQVTRLGMTARVDGERVHAWLHDLAPANFLAPLAGVTTSIAVDGRRRADTEPGKTDADGHAVFDLLPRSPAPARGAMVLAKSGDDSTFTAITGYERAIRETEARWYVTDDRFTYKPGETVYVKGWVRWSDTGINPDIRMPGIGDTVAYTLVDRAGVQLASGTAPLTDQGGFDVAVQLPPTPNLGNAMFTFSTRASAHRHTIQVQEFRTPNYGVTLNDDVTHAGTAPLVLGESIEMNAEARYYAGGGLAGSTVTWDAELRAASYTPPGWDLFAFDPPTVADYRRHDLVAVRHEDTLSSASASTAVFGITALPLGRPSVLTVDATVADVDRAHIRASSHAILVHPSTLYVGLHQRPDETGLDAIVTDIDGKPVAGVPIDIAIDGTMGSERRRSDAKQTDQQTCKLTSGAAPVTCTWKSKDIQFSYVATAHVADARGRTNTTQYAIPWWAVDDTRTFSIVPDRKSYRPGDVAKLDLRSKVVPATAIVTFARQGVMAQKRVALAQASTIVELPIEASYIEDVHVQVERVADRVTKAGARPLPEDVTEEVDLPVELDSARLQMTAKALTPLVEPGGEATFEVSVAHGGQPVEGAEVALMVVDEAVLALSHGTHADPLPVFYRKVDAGTQKLSTLALVDDAGTQLDGDPGFSTYGIEAITYGRGGFGYGLGGGGYGTIGHGSGTGTGVVAARKDFRPNAVFSPQLHTGPDGKVQLTVQMPDNLTRFRVVALATANMRWFGKAEGSIIAQRKINARTAVPRFLDQGDAFSLPVVVQNLDGVARTIDVAVRAGNLIATGPAGKRVVVAAGQRAEVRFDFKTRALGRAEVQTIVVSGDHADATNLDIPVYAPATTEAFAAYGTVDGAAPSFEQLAVPAGIYRDVGGVDLELSSTQLSSLTDAYWYLYAYPHECAEQRSSRMLATTAIYDILDAFQTPDRPSRDDIDAQRQRDVAKLAIDQNADGGWGYFRGMDSDPFVSMQVVAALGRGNAKAISYVTSWADRLQGQLDKAVALAPEKRIERASYPYTVELASAALASLAAAGVDAKARALRLHTAALALDTYPIDAKSRLLAIVAGSPRQRDMRARLLADLRSATEETASSATVTATFSEAERLLLVSNTKTSALALDAMIREQPDLPIITKLARGVLDMRRHGRWSSTQDNLVALRALRRYFDAYEKTTPSFTGKAWFGTDAYTERSFAGHTDDIARAHLDWTQLAPGSTHDLALVKDGAGRMYYRVGITYAPERADLPALDAGFIVRRTYAAIDDPADVSRVTGGWTIKLGARVRVTIEEINTTKRFGVALVDPLPAGFESVNDALATSERVTAVADDWRWQYRNLRDERSEAFAMALDEGRHQMSYVVRATTPGTFRAAPAKAEEMYAPETFGRSTGETVVIQ